MIDRKEIEMAKGIYRRVAELVHEKKQTLTDSELFQGKEYQQFLKRKAAAIITGTCYYLESIGFVVSKARENQILDTLVVEIEHNPSIDVTAYATSMPNLRLVHLNTGHELIMSLETREERHFAILGMLYHEIGHILFTDFPTAKAWVNQLERGKWFPAPPTQISSIDGINLQDAMDKNEDNFNAILRNCAMDVSNCLEDAYIERELKEMYPGEAVGVLAELNTSLVNKSKSLEEMLNDGVNPFFAIINQILLYAKFGEMDFGDYEGEIKDSLYEMIDVIDESCYQRDPQLRVKGVNELLCYLYPYLESAIEEEKENQKNQDQSQSQDGDDSEQGDGSGDSNSGSGAGSSSGSGSGSNPNATAENIIKKIKKVVKSITSQDDSDMVQNSNTSAINNPTSHQNQGAQPTQNKPAQTAQQQGQTDGDGDGDGSSGMGAGMNGGNNATDNAAKDLSRVVDKLVEDAAKEQAEAERTEEMNQQARSDDYSGYLGEDKPNISVSRASSPSEDQKAAYENVQAFVKTTSRDLRRQIERVLKDRRQGGVRKGLVFGRKIEVSSIPKEDGRIFSNKKLPTNAPRLGVGIQIDESGSTSGELIKAAITTSLILEDFCRELGIPHTIKGYTSEGFGDSARIFSYAEPDDIDNGNRYRITGMQSRGGTPTAAVMAHMLNCMKRLDADVRLLIIITDGQSGDNYEMPNGKRRIENMLAKAKKEKTIVVAAGIGADREYVQREFPGNYLDISDLNEMPKQLVGIIKKNLAI